jgi:exopolyphosphatase/guanosine-5'-triphosphate,3'-diphosphate pyrophosphatase
VAGFATRARLAGAGPIWAFATGAVRDAADGPELARQVEETSDVLVEVLRGAEEARLGWAAAAHAFGGREPMLAVDVGGRTTELTVGMGDAPDRTTSVALGVLALTESAGREDPPAAADLACLTDTIDAVLGASDVLAEARRIGARPVVSGGSASAMATLDLGLGAYVPRRVHGHRLSPATLQRIASELAAMPASARGALPGLEPGRGAVVLAGALVLGRLASILEAPLTVSGQGVRHGFLRARLLAAGRATDFREMWA